MIRRILLLLLIGVSLTAVFPFAWREWVEWRYDRYTYTVESAPGERVAVVFGARVYSNGRLSPMLHDRVETAVQLYEAGKVDALLMTGDNRSIYYNEPGAMRDYAIRRGVPAAAILLDPAGNRTYDSCYRAREIFGLETAVLVTQQFHLSRALFICRALGVEAVGVPADISNYNQFNLRRLQWRELGALTLALWDVTRRLPPEEVNSEK
jgi:SanA protein